MASFLLRYGLTGRQWLYKAILGYGPAFIILCWPEQPFRSGFQTRKTYINITKAIERPLCASESLMTSFDYKFANSFCAALRGRSARATGYERNPVVYPFSGAQRLFSSSYYLVSCLVLVCYRQADPHKRGYNTFRFVGGLGAAAPLLLANNFVDFP